MDRHRPLKVSDRHDDDEWKSKSRNMQYGLQPTIKYFTILLSYSFHWLVHSTIDSIQVNSKEISLSQIDRYERYKSKIVDSSPNPTHWKHVCDFAQFNSPITSTKKKLDNA